MMMKPFKALKFLISSNKNLKHHNSRSVIEVPDKSLNKTLPSDEKYRIKNSTSDTNPNNHDYLNQIINIDKEAYPLLLSRKSIFDEIGNEKNNKYERNFNILIQTIKENTRNTESLMENQRNMMDLMMKKFKNIDNFIKTLVSKNKTWRKKYEEITKTSEENVIFTHEIYNIFEKKKTTDILNRLEQMKHFFSEEVRIFMENRGKSENCNKKNDIVKKTQKNKNLSHTIQSLDQTIKKKFLISIQDKLKLRKDQENIENLGEINDSPQIRIANSEKILHRGPFSIKKESNQHKFLENVINKNLNQEISSPLIKINDKLPPKFDIFEENDDIKHLFTPAQEKKIITNLIKHEYKLTESAENIFFQDGNFGKENQVKFLIDANWWRDWINYVNGDIKTYPGEIINRNLIFEDFFSNDNFLGKRMFLKKDILEHHDYEAVSKNIFRYLKKWYRVDHEIVRFLKKDPLDNGKLFLDLYPERNKLALLHKKHRNRNLSNEDKVLYTNQSLTLNTWNDYPYDAKGSNLKSCSSFRGKSQIENYERSHKKKDKDNCKIY